MKIICNNGEGREPNPHEKFIDSQNNVYNMFWVDFEDEVKRLPVYDQSGKLFTGSGEYNAKLIEQHKRWEDIKWFDAQDGKRETHIGLENRQIYRLTDHIDPTDQEKEELKTSEKESVEQAAERFGNIFYNKDKPANTYTFHEGFKSGAHWQKSQPNLIEKEKVIELLEAMAKDFKQYGDHIELRTAQECISKIRAYGL